MTKDFDAWAREQGAPDPFVIGGQTFTPRSKLPALAMNKILRTLRSDDADEDEAVFEFFRVALKRSDRDRFIALLQSEGDDEDDNFISSAQLAELMKWLLEVYTGKVPESGDSSTSGPAVTGALSNVVSLTPRADSVS